MNWQDPSPHSVHVVSLATSDGSTGVWKLYTDHGK
jgi:hypothetical protein